MDMETEPYDDRGDAGVACSPVACTVSFHRPYLRYRHYK